MLNIKPQKKDSKVISINMVARKKMGRISMLKYFIIGSICLLPGVQLHYIAKVLLVTAVPAVLLIMLSFLLIVGPFIYSIRQLVKEYNSTK